MEVLELHGYTREEKKQIARRYLIPKQLGEHGLTADHITLTDDTVMEVIDHYTKEAGVRSLERELANVIRGVAVKVAGGESFKAEIGAADVAEYLGPPKYFSEVAERTEEPGVATGLAWTPVGGEILFIEATKMPGKGNLVLTGQLGAVMKESAQAALSYVRSHAVELGIAPDFLDRSDLHLHVPAGATPKDGPSAGTAILVAMVSLLTGRRVRHDTAMTGEITLRGAVLPVGGIKEKVLAAHRAGIKRVLLPDRNQKDLVDIPEEVRRSLETLLLKRVDEAILSALEPHPVAEVEMPLHGGHPAHPM
jgi:ATP-dependent Lon protease